MHIHNKRQGVKIQKYPSCSYLRMNGYGSLLRILHCSVHMESMIMIPNFILSLVIIRI